MKMKKWISLLLSAVMTLGLLTGCGGGQNADNGSNGGNTANNGGSQSTDVLYHVYHANPYVTLDPSIEYSNGILVLNESLEVQQINQTACEILNVRHPSDVLGEQVIRIRDPKDFLDVKNGGATIRDRRTYLAEYNKYVDETILYDASYRVLMCMMRDVTEEERQRRTKESIRQQTIETADKVVDKQMRIVQEIASLLGETAAETKIALAKLKESISDE